MKCPFCLNPIADSNPGEKICPNCQAEFEIDDRGECVFANPGQFEIADKRDRLQGVWTGSGRRRGIVAGIAVRRCPSVFIDYYRAES